jgi:uncharacterized protein YkwD
MKKLVALSLLTMAALAACTPAAPTGPTGPTGPTAPSTTPVPRTAVPQQTTIPTQQTIVGKPCHVTAPRMPVAPTVIDATEGQVTITAASPDSGVYYVVNVDGVTSAATSATSHTVTLPAGSTEVDVEARFSECGSASAVGYYSTTVDAVPLPATLEAIEADLVTRINQLRSANSRPALTLDTTLRAGARTWSTTRAARALVDDTEAHDDAWLDSPGAWSARSENVTPGVCGPGCTQKWTVFDFTGVAETAHTGFVNSTAHLTNMLASNVSRVGVGVGVHNAPGPGMHLVITERFAQPR